MNFSTLTTGQDGLIHFIFALIALVTGAVILLGRKGTLLHRRIGYVYCVAMAGVFIDFPL